MVLNLKDNGDYKKKILIFSSLALLFGLFALLFGFLFVPVAAAFCAIVFLLEIGRKRIFSILIPVVILFANSAKFFVGEGFPLLDGVEAVILGFTIYLCISHEISKSECVFWTCAAAAIFVLIDLAIIAVSYIGDFSFAGIVDFYSELSGSVKDLLIVNLNDFYSSVPEVTDGAYLSTEQIGVLFDSFISLSVSYIVIFCFALSGVALKIVSFTVLRLSGDIKWIASWRFKTTSIFAYAYIVLYILSVFATNSGTLFAVTVANLFNIFCVIYAYFGFNYLLTLLSLKKSPAFSFIVLMLGVVFLSSLMINILSMIGVFAIISLNKTKAGK